MSMKIILLVIAMILVVVSVLGTYTVLTTIDNTRVLSATPSNGGFVGFFVGNPTGSGDVGFEILSPEVSETG